MITLTRQRFARFGSSAMMFIPVLVLCLSMPLYYSCNTTDPVIFLNVKELRIVTNVPAGTEGVPNNRYTFTALHSKVTIPIRYEWNFDDTTTVVVRDSGVIHHTFLQDGYYAVMVRVMSDESQRELSRATTVINIRSTIPKINMVDIPAGTYLMGSNRGVDQSEQPLHYVTISRPLLVGRYELKQSEWKAIMSNAPAWFQDDSLPLENVNWYQAIDYCNRLSIRSGFTPCYTINGESVSCLFSANGYRLPTEAEWEYCARAGTNTDFYSGNVTNPFASCLTDDTLETVVDSIAWFCLNSEGKTHRGGLKKPNAFGLFDMIGNVSEWTWDYYDGNYYRNSPTLDPRGPSTSTRRVERGGDFSLGVINIRSSCRRMSSPPTLKSFSVGFRVVRSPS